MSRLNTFRFIIFGIFLILTHSCINNAENASINSNTLLELEDLEASKIDSLYQVVGKTDYTSDYRHINQVLSQSPSTKDTLVLAKAYGLIGLEHIFSNDYEKAIKYLEESVTLFKKLNMWVEVMRNHKNLATIYRHQYKLDLMTPLLKNDMYLMDSLATNSFGILYPIHELTVHYSYDLGKHDEAIEHGELFFEKLAHFDSLQISSSHFKYIKESEKDVIHLIMGVSYLKVGQTEKAYQHLNQAYAAYNKPEFPEMLSRVHKAFMEYYLQSGNKEKLIFHKEEYYKSTLNYINAFSESQKEINALKIELLEDEKALQLLQEENRFKSILIYLEIAGLLILTFLWRYRSKLIQEKREVALQLEKQYEFNEFKTNLLITVAHELRTPLTIILGHLQLISEKKVKPEKFKLYFNKIKGSSEGILNKMSDIIRLVKEENTEAIAIFRTIEVWPFFKGLFFRFEVMARIKKIELSLNCELDQNHTIRTDPKILGGLLNNLILNAIKFSPSGSKVEMNISHNGKELLVDIIDDGVGINDENQKKIFDKFNRVSTSSKIDGFGLGLVIVKKSTEQLNGAIRVKSSLGEGSTFSLTLPNKMTVKIVGQKSSIAPKRGNVINVNTTEKGNLSKVLVVEDNPEMCNFYEHIFSGIFNYTFVFNGQEGLDALRKNSFDIIISDVMMPEIDGFEFKKKIRSLPRSKNIPFIMVTAKDQDESKIQAFDIGVDDYIIKPFNKNELISRIKALVTNKKEREKWSMSRNSEIYPVNETFDVKTIRKLRETVLGSYDDENFCVTNLAEEVGMSQRQLVRVTKKLTGLTPVKFILEVRLTEAYKKIKSNEKSDINAVRFAVGIQSASYFSTQFKKRFGINPKDLFNEQKKQYTKIW